MLVRHGESTNNTGRIATSAPDGYPLTERGRGQAADVAGELADPASVRYAGLVQRVYSSTIQPAIQTAQIAGGRLRAPVTVVDGLQEIDVGIFEGRSERELPLDGAVNFRRWLGDGDLDHGFVGGETARQVATRVSAALADVAARHDGGTVVVVSHGGALVLTLPRLCWNLSPAFVQDRLLDNCDAVTVEVAGDEWTCSWWAGVRCHAWPTRPG